MVMQKDKNRTLFSVSSYENNGAFLYDARKESVLLLGSNIRL